ncbi:MAG: carboxypeptidase-like regulatory domain-containing protein [Bryobacteraceae bacterium]
MLRFLAAIPLFVSAAFAQVQAGRIVGTVFDASKAAVPGASVTVTEVNTNAVHRVTANATGDYVVTPLLPGLYSVSVSSPGFQTIVKNRIELQVGQVARVDVDLVVGETVTKLEVNADVPVLDTDSGTLGQVINNQQIVSLPLNGRGFYELARLTPGAALLPGSGNVLRIRPEFINGTAISGVRGRSITFLMDGVDISEQHQGGTFIQTSIDALQEFKVQQNGYSAEFSRAGGMLNATTKAGTNDFHGAAFDFLRNDKLDARNFFARNREILKRNQFGGVLSGPLWIPGVPSGKDKMFFLLSYEGMRERQGLVFNNLVPTMANRQGNFAGTAAIFDPLTTSGTTRTPFPGNIIPTSQLAPQALYFNKYIAEPNTAAGTASLAPSRQLDQDQFTLRVDRNLSDAHKLFVRWSFHDNRQNDPNAHPALGIAPLTTRATNIAASLTSNLGTRWVHEFR